MLKNWEGVKIFNLNDSPLENITEPNYCYQKTHNVPSWSDPFKTLTVHFWCKMSNLYSQWKDQKSKNFSTQFIFLFIRVSWKDNFDVVAFTHLDVEILYFSSNLCHSQLGWHKTRCWNLGQFLNEKKPNLSLKMILSFTIRNLNIINIVYSHKLSWRNKHLSKTCLLLLLLCRYEWKTKSRLKVSHVRWICRWNKK